MIHKSSNPSKKLRLVPHYGDVAIFFNIVKSDMWKKLFKSQPISWSKLFIWILKAKAELFALPSRALFRYNHGKNTTGIFMTVWCTTMLASMNADHWLSYVIGIVPFISIIFAIALPSEVFLSYLTDQVRSEALMVYIFLSFIAQVTHIVRLYSGKGKADDAAKRGSSWLMKLTKDQNDTDEFYIQTLAEPSLLVAVAYLVYSASGDLTFLIVMSFSALSIAGQEVIDGLYRYRNSK